MHLLTVVLLALAQQAIRVNSQHASLEATHETKGVNHHQHKGYRQLLSTELETGFEDIAAPIEGRYVVIIKPFDGSIAAATDRLVKYVEQTSTKLPRRAAAATAASTSSSTGFTVLHTLQYAPGLADADAPAVVTATATAGSNSVQALVVQAPPDLLDVIQHSKEVSAVFQDRIIGAQVTAAVRRRSTCVEVRELSAGTISSNSVTADFKWPSCLTSQSRLVWIGRRCGDMSSIEYVAIYAVDKATGAVRSVRGSECILRPDPAKAAWTRQRFGSCGRSPTYARDLPTAVCSPTATAASGNCFSLSSAAPSMASSITADAALTQPAACNGRNYRRLTYTGRPCGPAGAFVQWTQATTPDGCTITNPNPTPRSFSKQSSDVFGSCGVPPGRARQVIPSTICPPETTNASPGNRNPRNPSPDPGLPGTEPRASPSPSPTPEMVNLGPRLPRAPVVEGEVVPAGVSVIEAATAEGVANTAGLPFEKQVVVAVVDSGVDASHPDVNYIGGQSWVEQSATAGSDDPAADVDLYGHGTHVAGIIAAKNSGQGVVGVSPGTPIYSLKVLDGKGRGSLSNMLSAVSWAATEGVKQGIKVINLSLAAFMDPSSADYAVVYDAVCGVMKLADDAGILVVAAAGNYAMNFKGYFPAACPTVAAVTAVDTSRKAPAEFSNFLNNNFQEDKRHVIAAPGVNIRSTISYARETSGYRELSGTSQAAPHIAGIAANCIMSQACTGTTGSQHLANLQTAAQLRLTLPGAATYGFKGDSTSTENGKYYGNMAWAAY